MAKRTRVKFPKIGRKSTKSKFEFSTYEILVADEKVSDVQYESEKFDYTVAYTYTPDFVITTKSGKKLYIETKGAGRSFDSASQQKLRSVREQHPEIDLRILFYRDAPLARGSKFTQSKWAEKYGFTYAIGAIPDDWFE